MWPRGKGDGLRKFAELCCCLGNSISQGVQANEPCLGCVGLVDLAFFVAGNPMNLDITLFGGISNVAPKILIGAWNPALPLLQASKTFRDSHGITDVGGRALRTPEETQESLELCTRDSLAAIESTITREHRFQTPPSVDHDKTIPTSPIPWVF